MPKGIYERSKLKGKTYEEIYGKEKATELRKVRSLRMMGSKHPRWNGGKTLHGKGYILIRNPNHPNASISGYVPEHRLVMEANIGRYLRREEVVHHLDFDKTHNNIDNLHLFQNESGHRKYEHFLKNCVREVIL